MRIWQLTLTPAPGERAMTRAVGHDELVELLRSVAAGEVPSGAELAVEEVAVRGSTPELALAG